jgi:hypothetical protein
VPRLLRFIVLISSQVELTHWSLFSIARPALDLESNMLDKKDRLQLESLGYAFILKEFLFIIIVALFFFHRVIEEYKNTASLFYLIAIIILVL